MKTGVLYERHKRQKRGEVSISAIVAKLKRLARSLRWSGASLILVGIAGLGWIYYPLASAEINYQLHPPQPESKFGALLGDWPNWQVPDSSYSLYIPKIDAKARVVPNVDANNEQAYLMALKIGVAEVSGLAHPGQTGTTYMFAHSTDSPINFARYNALFYLLDRMDIGDRAEVVYQNKLYRYKVVSREILEPDDVRYLTPQQDTEQLVLQTCYPPGTTWRRLVLVAKRT